ncbi:MAG: hypothetical protein ABI832_08125, partial [bacterium]
MSSLEIEDVLSSIRRLVSEDLRPGNKANAATRATSAATASPAPTAKADEKLILTPAFRVVSPNRTSPVVAAPPRPSALPRLHLGADPVIEDLAATLERAVEAQDFEWESETGDAAPLVAEPEWTEDGWAELTPPDVIAETIAETIVDPQPPQAAPSWAQPDPDDAEADPVAEGVQPVRHAPIAEPDAYWADQAEAEAVAELRNAARPATSINEEMTFDEEVLRDLVRDIIREELQGGLGERITRNVRKLVRAEI